MTKRVEFDRDKAVELYKSGVSPSQIGRDLNVNYQTVILHLKKVGIYKMNVEHTEKIGLKPVSTVGKKPKKDKEVTMKEKIAYCDKKYGKGKWHFMSKEEFMKRIMLDKEK